MFQAGVSEKVSEQWPFSRHRCLSAICNRFIYLQYERCHPCDCQSRSWNWVFFALILHIFLEWIKINNQTASLNWDWRGILPNCSETSLPMGVLVSVYRKGLSKCIAVTMLCTQSEHIILTNWLDIMCGCSSRQGCMWGEDGASGGYGHAPWDG
jgi:hypothetical protein